MSGNFTTWRWLILVGCLAPAYWAAEGIARLFELAVEWRYFEDRRVLYYLIGTTVGPRVTKNSRVIAHHHEKTAVNLILAMTLTPAIALGLQTGPRLSMHSYLST